MPRIIPVDVSVPILDKDLNHVPMRCGKDLHTLRRRRAPQTHCVRNHLMLAQLAIVVKELVAQILRLRPTKLHGRNLCAERGNLRRKTFGIVDCLQVLPLQLLVEFTHMNGSAALPEQLVFLNQSHILGEHPTHLFHQRPDTALHLIVRGSNLANKDRKQRI